MFVNDASLDSSRESGFPGDYDEDNRPVAQFSLLKTRGEEGEVVNNVCGLCSTLTDHPGLTYFQVLINRSLDKTTGLQLGFSKTADDSQKVGSPTGAYTTYMVYTRVSASPP